MRFGDGKNREDFEDCSSTTVVPGPFDRGGERALSLLKSDEGIFFSERAAVEERDKEADGARLGFEGRRGSRKWVI